MLESVGSVSKAQSASPAPTRTGTDYRIKLGDTLGDIAKRNGVSIDALAKANGITNPNRIFAGQVISIPGGGKTQAVERGDTLTKIAAENNTTVDALMKANPEIRNANQIYPGQVVRIAGAEARPASKAAPRVQNPQAPVAKAPEAQAPVAPKGPVGPTTTGQINLQEFFDPSKGSKSPAAIVIGNAEGNRRPDGSFTASASGHTDPGNNAANVGSFSKQGMAGSTIEQADRAQLKVLSGQIPTYQAAVQKAGLDPNNALLASSYFDLYNQSPTAAARFLDQVGVLKTSGISEKSVNQLRFNSFVDRNTGQRFVNSKGVSAGGGFAKIAQKELTKAGISRKPTEAEIQNVVKRDQARRTGAMIRALDVQGFDINAKPAASPPTAKAPSAGAPAVVDKPGVGSSSNYEAILGRFGDAQAKADFAAGKKVVLAIRTETLDTSGKNRRGAYDDTMVVMQKGADGKVTVQEFRGNTDPAYSTSGKFGPDLNGDGKREIGQLVTGSYRYSREAGTYKKTGQAFFRSQSTQAAIRDTNGDGRFTSADMVDRYGAGRSMLIHAGGVNGTGSAGCQTMSPATYKAFLEAIGSQSTFSYVLVNR
jgi:LysM repeat protein